MKTCFVCRAEKTPEQFTKRKSSKDGLGSYCLDCYAEKSREERRLFPERNKAAVKKWAERNPEKRKQISSDWLKTNPKKTSEFSKRYREKHPEVRKEYEKKRYWENLEREKARYKKYCQANSHVIVAKTQRRMAAKLRATPPWLTNAHHDQIKAIYGERVRISKETGIVHHVDHIHPLRGENFSGLHVPWNLQIIPAKENRLKQNRMPNGN